MAITGPEATIIACVVAAIMAFYIRWRNSFGSASNEFLKAFNSDVTAIKTGTIQTTVHEFLLSSFARHQAAAIVFRRHLRWRKLAAFDKAWDQYQGGKEYEASANLVNLSTEERKLMPYVAQGTEEENRRLAIANIHALLQFAKP